MHFISSGKDFFISNVTLSPPQYTITYILPIFFKSVDDEVNEIEQSFAVIAHIGDDVPLDVGCFKVTNEATECFGRYGAFKVNIIDDDGKNNSEQ